MPDMEAIITSQNKKLLKKETSQQSKPCNCKNKDICPLKDLVKSNVSSIKQIYLFKIQGVHKVLHTFKILISQKPHKVETLNFRQ